MSYAAMNLFLIRSSQIVLIVDFFFLMIVYLHLYYLSLFMAQDFYLGQSAELLKMTRGLSWIFFLSDTLVCKVQNSLWGSMRLLRLEIMKNCNIGAMCSIQKDVVDIREVDNLQVYNMRSLFLSLKNLYLLILELEFLQFAILSIFWPFFPFFSILQIGGEIL